MSRIVSCVTSLQQFLNMSLTAETISEKLHAHPASMSAADLQRELKQHSFDIAVILDPNSKRVYRYVRIEMLTHGSCGDCAEPVPLDGTVARATPLRDCLQAILDRNRVFVLGRSGIEEIITRADLEKQPVRLLLFGVISTLEMAMLGLLRQRFPNEEWEQHLSAGRLDEAQKILEGRVKRNEEIDLADCLQICDKLNVLLKDKTVLDVWGFKSKSEARKFFDRIQRLRDKLAHAHDPASGSSWDDVVAAFHQAQKLLDLTTNLLKVGNAAFLQ